MTISVCEKCNGGIVDTTKSNACNQCGGDASTVDVMPAIPVYKFHLPLDCTGYGYGKDGLKHYGTLRYAEGRWIPTDGEPDLAFVGFTPWNDGKGGAPIHYGVEIPWQLRWRHPNGIAYESACRKCVKIGGCASGRTVTRRRWRASAVAND